MEKQMSGALGRVLVGLVDHGGLALHLDVLGQAKYKSSVLELVFGRHVPLGPLLQEGRVAFPVLLAKGGALDALLVTVGQLQPAGCQQEVGVGEAGHDLLDLAQKDLVVEVDNVELVVLAVVELVLVVGAAEGSALVEGEHLLQGQLVGVLVDAQAGRDAADDDLVDVVPPQQEGLLLHQLHHHVVHLLDHAFPDGLPADLVDAAADVLLKSLQHAQLVYAHHLLVVGDDLEPQLGLPDLLHQEAPLQLVQVVIDGLGQLDEEPEPVDGPEGVELVHPEDLAVPGVVPAVGLVYEVEHLRAQAQDGQQGQVGLKDFLDLLVVHVDGNVHAVGEELVDLRLPSLHVLASGRELMDHRFQHPRNLLIELLETRRVVLLVALLHSLELVLLQVLYAVPDPGQVLHPDGQGCLLHRTYPAQGSRQPGSTGLLGDASLAVEAYSLADKAILICFLMKALGSHVLPEFQEAHFVDGELRAVLEPLGVHIAEVVDEPLQHRRLVEQEVKIDHLGQVSPGVALAENLYELLVVAFMGQLQGGVAEVGESEELGDALLDCLTAAQLQIGHVGLVDEEGHHARDHLQGVGLVAEVLGDQVDQPEQRGQQVIDVVVDAQFLADGPAGQPIFLEDPEAELQVFELVQEGRGAGGPLFSHADDVIEEVLLGDLGAAFDELLHAEAEGHAEMGLDSGQPLALADDGRAYEDAEFGAGLPRLPDEGVDELLDFLEGDLVQVQRDLAHRAVYQFGIHAMTQQMQQILNNAAKPGRFKVGDPATPAPHSSCPPLLSHPSTANLRQIQQMV